MPTTSWEPECRCTKGTTPICRGVNFLFFYLLPIPKLRYLLAKCTSLIFPPLVKQYKCLRCPQKVIIDHLIVQKYRFYDLHSFRKIKLPRNYFVFELPRVIDKFLAQDRRKRVRQLSLHARAVIQKYIFEHISTLSWFIRFGTLTLLSLP